MARKPLYPDPGALPEDFLSGDKVRIHNILDKLERTFLQVERR